MHNAQDISAHLKGVLKNALIQQLLEIQQQMEAFLSNVLTRVLLIV
jgi:hypothetical protein